jgi:hypothetical protein
MKVFNTRVRLKTITAASSLRENFNAVSDVGRRSNQAGLQPVCFQFREEDVLSEDAFFRRPS